ncbi:transposase [Sphingobium lactosutens]
MRALIEKIFGTWKRCYGLRRMRWRGLAKAAFEGIGNSSQPKARFSMQC